MKISIVFVIIILIFSGCKENGTDSNDLLNRLLEENSRLEDLLKEVEDVNASLNEQIYSLQIEYDLLLSDKTITEKNADELNDKYAMLQEKYSELMRSIELESDTAMEITMYEDLVKQYRNRLVMLSQYNEEHNFDLKFSIGSTLGVLSDIEDDYIFLDEFNEYLGMTMTTVIGTDFELLYDPISVVRIRMKSNLYTGSLPVSIGQDYGEAMDICDGLFERMSNHQGESISHWFILEDGNYLILYSEINLTASSQTDGTNDKLVMIEIGSPIIYD